MPLHCASAVRRCYTHPAACYAGCPWLTDSKPARTPPCACACAPACVQDAPAVEEAGAEEAAAQAADQFKREVAETFLRCIHECISHENAVIELNGLKIAEDRTFGDCARWVRVAGGGVGWGGTAGLPLVAGCCCFVAA